MLFVPRIGGRMEIKMKLPIEVKTASDILKSKGFEAFAVGGCVRDFVMGKTPSDYDMTTDATPQQMLCVFKDFRIIETGLQHGTVTVVINGENVEITTYRIDGEYEDNRRPKSVTYTKKLSDDLSRRDFTVNSMAYSENDGLVDLFGGQADIKSKTIRCVGEPDLRFSEDGLRILRAMRFASVLGFSIEEKTSESIHKNRNLLKNISAERIFTELSKLVCGVGAENILREYGDVFEVFTGVYPKYESIGKAPADFSTRLAMLLRGSENTGEILSRLRSDNVTKKNTLAVCRRIHEQYETEVSVKYLLRDIGTENATRLAQAKLALGFGDCLINLIDSCKEQCFSIPLLKTDGSELIATGIPKGKTVGEVLNALLDAVIKGEIPNRKQSLLEFAKTVLDNSPHA